MVHVIRTKRWVNAKKWINGCSGFSLPTVTISSFLDLRTFGTMNQVKVHGASDSSLPISDGEDHFQQSVSGSTEERSLSSNVQSTPEIEKKYVHRVYDAIAPHFSSTRFAKWPKVAAFLNSLPSGSLVLDAGCGNGKYLGISPSCFFLGCDISARLISICADRGHEVLVADAVNLPYRSGYGDSAISIAVLHHLSTESRRKKAISELIRVVKTGGLVLITVWAVEQEDSSLLKKWTPLTQKYVAEWVGPSSPRVRTNTSPFSLQSIPEAEGKSLGSFEEGSETRFSKESPESILSVPESTDDPVTYNDEKDMEMRQEYFVPWHLPYHRAEVGGASASALENGLAKKDDKKGAVVYNRYYHVFSEGELERLVSDMDNAIIVDRFFDKSNWCIVLEKTK